MTVKDKINMLIENINKELNKDRNCNTTRRANMASNITDRLSIKLWYAKTLLKLCDDYKIKHLSQIEFIENTLNQAIIQFNRKYNYTRNKDYDYPKQEHIQFAIYDIKFKRLWINNYDEMIIFLNDYIKIRNWKEEKSKETILKEKWLELCRLWIPGFFPTPDEIILKMIEYLPNNKDIEILEPSAGKWDIIDILIQEWYKNIDCIEYNYSLRDYLKEKWYNVIWENILKYKWKEYDAIVMNPPFEKQVDIDHILYCFDNLLKEWWILISIMSEWPFFRQDNKSKSFIEFINNCWYDIKLNQVFKNWDVKTGVFTRMIIVNK